MSVISYLYLFLWTETNLCNILFVHDRAKAVSQPFFRVSQTFEINDATIATKVTDIRTLKYYMGNLLRLLQVFV